MKIYHSKNQNAPFGKASDYPTDFMLVAEVDAFDLEHAFQLSYSTGANWTLNAEVKNAISNDLRDTAIGDAIEDNNGVIWGRSLMGWHRLKNKI